MIRKSWYTGTVLILLFFMWVLLSLPAKPDLKSDETSLRIAAKNVLYCNPNQSLLFQDIISEQIDIVLFLEYNGKNINLGSFQQAGFKPVVVHPRSYTHGMLLLAKSALNIEGAIHTSPATGLCRLPYTVARLHYRNHAVALLGVHIPPPTKRCAGTRQPTIEYLASLVKNGRLITNLEMAKAGDAVIMLGDFNTISLESALDPLFVAGLEDVYSRHHWRPGPTWSQPIWLPAVFRLDYILVSREIPTSGAWAVHIKGSDHRGIIADIVRR
jgi:endonuclease/exonuclease/phosphatase (EEP) superfamily protein YafD